MDFLHTLLTTIASTITTALVALQIAFGGIFIDEQKITLPLPKEVSTSFATSSSKKIIGTSATSTQPTPKPAKKSEAKLVSSPVPTTTLPAVVAPPPSINSEALNTQTREALVNILCDTKGGGVHPISGSGVFIDTRGVILTNAHVGQYFLLKDYPSRDNVSCTIRIGSPASPRYTATLIYLPPAWVSSNSTQIIAEQAKGTGENDYAFLLVTDSTGPTPVPLQFPHLTITIAEPDLSVSMLLAAYPAGFLDGSSIQKNLYVSSAYAAVKELFTFGVNRDVDLVSVGGTVVSQGGSSGGAVVRANDGVLQGIITTSTAADSTAERDLRAITLAHINRSLITQGQGGLVSFLSQDMLAAATRFASSTAPGEKELLVKAIEHR